MDDPSESLVVDLEKLFLHTQRTNVKETIKSPYRDIDTEVANDNKERLDEPRGF